ncbi:hypothetical protein SDJN03_08787, partial [Cucurbita argyrosperma subsp. sororia]
MGDCCWQPKKERGCGNQRKGMIIPEPSLPCCYGGCCWQPKKENVSLPYCYGTVAYGNVADNQIILHPKVDPYAKMILPFWTKSAILKNISTLHEAVAGNQIILQPKVDPYAKRILLSWAKFCCFQEYLYHVVMRAVADN